VECKNNSDTCNNKSNWKHFKSSGKYLSNIPGNQTIEELQKTSIFCTISLKAEVLTELKLRGPK
jgi:hypothetical protein